MWSIILVGFLFRPVDRLEAGQPADKQLPVAACANLLRGRVLALTIKQGMTKREVHDRLGCPTFGGSSCGLMCWDEVYDCLGVGVDYKARRYEGEDGTMHSEWVVEGVRAAPLLDFLPWFHSGTWIDLTP